MSIHPVTFEHMYHEWYFPLVFFARRLVRDQLVAEDIVTEVFIKFWYRENNYEDAIAKKRFLFLCTRNKCINHIREKKHREKQKKGAPGTTDDYEEFALNQITRNETITQAWNIIESLPTECRRIFILSYLKGISHKKIAQQLGISVNTVRNHKTRGFELMKERFKKLEMANMSSDETTHQTKGKTVTLLKRNWLYMYWLYK